MSGWCGFRLLSIKLTQSGALSLGMVAAGNEERDLLTGRAGKERQKLHCAPLEALSQGSRVLWTEFLSPWNGGILPRPEKAQRRWRQEERSLEWRQISCWSISLEICCCYCLVAQSCPTYCDPMDCSPPSSSVHGLSQARLLEWVAISFSRGSFQPRAGTRVSCIDRQILYPLATWEAQKYKRE